MATDAPFHAELADGPEAGRAIWMTADDGVRLRLALWPVDRASGTVLLFPGRTEYIEKYGRAARDLNARGLSVIAIDWRGQGLSDRLLPDKLSGHVRRFSDYQRDVAAMLTAAREAGLAEPYTLIGHSMGGCIGLRALKDGLPVKAAAFSAPMWGIAMSAAMRPLAWGLSWAARRVLQGHRYAPGTSGTAYPLSVDLAENMLTRDPEMFEYMRAQVSAHPELALGGPSLTWLSEALMECRALAALPSPDLPCITHLGSLERIVDPAPVHERMARWPKGTLVIAETAEHEIMMERAEVRNAFFDDVARLAGG